MKTRIAIALACALVACGTTKREKDVAKQQKIAQIGLQEMTDEINYRTQAVARQVSMETEDREIRRRMIVWQRQTLASTRRSMQLPDPRWVFLDLWVMLYQTKIYVEHGDGKGHLGEQEPIVIAALDNMLDGVRERTRTTLSKKQTDELGAVAKNWAAEHPIEGDSMLRPARPSPKDGGAFGALMSLPANIFSFGGGVKDTAMSISEVAAAAERGVDSVDSLPMVARWETELLVYSLEENETTQRLVANADKVSESVVRISKTVEEFPDTIDMTISRAIERVEQTQPEFRKTLDEGRGIVEQAHGTATEVRAAIDTLQESGKWVETTSANVVAAGEAWTGALKEVNLLAASDPDAPESPPFDIKDAAATAEWATKAATEVHGSVVELRAILEGDAIDKRMRNVDQVLDTSTERVAGLVDKITWRAAALIVVFFVALLGYRIGAARIAR